MDRLERFYRIHRLLKAGRCLPLAHFMDALQVSRATLKRDLEYLRDRLEAPLVYDRMQGGYRYDLEQKGADRYDLPGVWFSAAEIHALVVAHGLLSEISPGLLGSLHPLVARLEKLLEEHRLPAAEVGRRIRVFNVAHRAAPPQHFARAAQAVLQRERLRLRHFHRGEQRHTEREVSPQRLIHYRGTCYLDTWCHLREALRSFSLDAIERLEGIAGPIREVPDAVLQQHFSGSYGIFSGQAAQTAVLRFSPERARWVRHERWHPDQVGVEEPDGAYRLSVPYGDDTELVMEVLRHGAEVEVLEPPELRRRVAAEASRLAGLYR